MNRREFIRRSLLALPAISLAPALLTSCQREDLSLISTDLRVTIIGAGISGLAAAWYFNQRGVATTVLEARNRIGGRIATDRSEGFPFDLGASWIHGPRQNPISDLAEEAGASTYKTKDDSVKVYGPAGQISDSTLSDFEKEYEEVLDTLRENGDVNTSFWDAFEARWPSRTSDPIWLYLLSSYLEFDSGGSVKELSSLDFDDDEAYRGKDVIITNGYDTLTNYLATGLDIELEEVVETIEYTGEAINVVTNSGTRETDVLLVTVPLGVLKENDILFNPALPDTLQGAVDRMQMGNVNKYLLLWDSPFWDTELQYIGYTPDVQGKFNYFLNTRTFSDVNGLMTFTYGDYSTEAEGLDDSQVIEAVMENLRAIYPSAPDPSTLQRTRWGSDPFSHGSYSFATNGTRSTDYDLLGTSIESRIYFAGEHTSRLRRSTVHGAYESGLREARRIAGILG